jgi:hypothetical protein
MSIPAPSPLGRESGVSNAPRWWPIRNPDFIVGDADNPYLRRWWLIPRNRWVNIYLHQFLRDDDDSALHDHPYCNMSLLLRGSYVEHMPGRSAVRRPWLPVFRRPTSAHRVELIDGAPVWTLFITGPRVREWGFHCPKGWVRWQDFTNPGDKGTIGKGCGE